MHPQNGRRDKASRGWTDCPMSRAWAVGSRVRVGAAGLSLLCTGAPSQYPGPRPQPPCQLASPPLRGSQNVSAPHHSGCLLCLHRHPAGSTACMAQGRLPLLSSVQRRRQADASPPSHSVLSSDETMLPGWLPMSHRCPERLWASPPHSAGGAEAPASPQGPRQEGTAAEGTDARLLGGLGRYLETRGAEGSPHTRHQTSQRRSGTSEPH